MPTYEYKCTSCAKQEDVFLMGAEIKDGVPTEFICTSCEGQMLRVYAGTTPGIGAVEGAGGSPARTKSYKGNGWSRPWSS